ncbi:MAG: serine/threonine protein kinase [Labilithrix sp.]|nr:serine/threonine protein kinase [Labilithrix sp.]MCW5815532.1 serine/threonine protein kinase [Labilithrix sp.]
MGPAAESRARYLARVGSLLGGQWRLEQLLGWGATSAVYEAVGREGAHRAVKILHRPLSDDPFVVERFLHEAYVAGSIRHRAIVGVHGDGVCDGSIYLVLDLLEGETLEERRLHMGGKLPLDAVVLIAEELLSALRAVHAAGVVHRDLKPQNVFATTHGELKLLDFGTARIFEPGPCAPKTKSIEGLVVGSPSFMSPEQARGARGAIDARSDLWSLGATLFTLLSGEYVHIARDPHKRLLAAAMKPARSLAVAAPWAPPELVAVVDRALAFDPAARWQDAVSMRRALRAACAVLDPPMSEPPPSSSAMV